MCRCAKLLLPPLPLLLLPFAVTGILFSFPEHSFPFSTAMVLIFFPTLFYALVYYCWSYFSDRTTPTLKKWMQFSIGLTALLFAFVLIVMVSVSAIGFILLSKTGWVTGTSLFSLYCAGAGYSVATVMGFVLWHEEKKLRPLHRKAGVTTGLLQGATTIFLAIHPAITVIGWICFLVIAPILHWNIIGRHFPPNSIKSTRREIKPILT